MFSCVGNLKRLYAIVTCAALLLSFGLHAVQVEHKHHGTVSSHQHAHTSGDTNEQSASVAFIFLADQMHQSNEKWLLLFLVSAYLLVVLWERTWSHQNATANALAALSLRHHPLRASRLLDHLALAYSSGTLNPKPF